MSDERPQFGPRGYVPERAARRARKIVLRAPLGLHWVAGAVVTAVVVAVAGVVFLVRSEDPPGPPFTAFGPVSQVGDVSRADGLVLVGAGGRVRAFAVATGTELVFCDESGRLEASDGRVWSLTGRGLGGTPSLAGHPTVVVDGIVYVDPTTTVAGPPAAVDPTEPACV